MEALEPIAIVGMACRFAGGVDSLDRFWTLLREGRDTVGQLPTGRWDGYAARGPGYATAVRAATRYGSFLDDVAGFDAEFFGVTPREAALMDPQQRIMLELAWEALEHAGIPPGALAGSDTGVFMGVGADDYGRRLLEDLPRIEAWTGIGSAHCGVANRVSFLLDLRGPSLAVDTACSSSLVSIHLAMQALRAGECPVALAGGVLVIAAPGLSLVLDAAGATAPDGRSKSFDAEADGYGRGEGGGVVVLKTLTNACRDGDRVLAVIRGSAVHQDGRTDGIMAPSAQAQAHLLRRAYRVTRIDPATVDYVEAHGTGTRAGDPIEADAMAAVFGARRPVDRPLLIGSVKPNIGHLEAGAGIAGVIKSVLALRHGEIPPSLNVTTPNPAISWNTAALRVVTEATRWPEAHRPRRAGVSGYGYGGTIAHVILEQAAVPEQAAGAEPAGPALFPLSGASPAAVRQYAGRLADQLSGVDAPPAADVGHTLAHRRGHLPHRAVVVATDRPQLAARLREVAGNGPGAATGVVLPGAGRGLVWVFSGHGSHWPGMARELLADDPAFAGVINVLEPVFVEELGISPRAVIKEGARLPVDLAQPMIFAVQLALGAAWLALGVRPAAVLGHSVGEIAAAVTAGVLTPEQGARLVCRRSVLLRRIAGRGAMAMVTLPPEQVEARLTGRTDAAVAVAAAPDAAVISGDTAAIEKISRQWHAEGIWVQPVDSDVAFHSRHTDPLLDPLATAAADLPAGPARIPVYSTVLTDPRSAAPRDGAYWAANLRRQVRFAPAVTAAAADGYRLFVEISPHPVVAHSVTETLDAAEVDDAYVAHSLRRHRPERETLLTNLGLLHCHGAELDWSALWPTTGRLADLPTTAWQHRPHWAVEPVAGATATPHDPASHTLLGGRIDVHGTPPARVWLTHLDRDSRPYPGTHPVREVETVPAAVLLHTFTIAGAAAGSWPDLTDVALRAPVTLTTARELQVVLQDGGIRLTSRTEDGDEQGWITHTTAVVVSHSEIGPEPADPALAGDELPASYVVERLASLGVTGIGFPWVVERLHRGEATLVATVCVDPDRDRAPAGWAPLLDAALSTASVAFPGPPLLRLPAHIHRVSLAPEPPARARITVRVTGEDTVDVEIADGRAGNGTGAVAGRLSRLRYGRLDGEAYAVTNPRQLVHELAWRPVARVDSGPMPEVVLVGPETALLGRLVKHLGDAGVRHQVAADPDDLPEADLVRGHAVLVVPAPGQPDQLAVAAAGSAWLLARTAQRLAAARPATSARLWCVTEGVRECRDERALGHGPVWGLGRIIGGEHPEFWGGVIDIGQSPDDIPSLIDVLRTVRGEDVVVIRDGQPSVARLRRPDSDQLRPVPACRPDSTYLVTGGLGALGREVAHWLADRGARRIMLANRRTLPSRDLWDRLTDPEERAQVETIRALERLGLTVVPVAVDIADPDAAAWRLSPGRLGLPPIRGVVHAAGVLDNRTLVSLDEPSLQTVLRPKVDGTVVLHRLFPPGSVDFFVLFSSCGQLLGLPGQASYAAANAFLDTLAAHRRQAGDTAATSVGWTSWRGLGMSTSSTVIDAELAARGTADIRPADAFAAWELVQRYGLGYAAVLRTIPLEPGGRRLPLLSELTVEPTCEEGALVEPATPPWVGLAGAELHEFLTEEIRRQVVAETRLATAEVDPRRPLVEMGLDSVMTVRIRRGLERRFQLPLPVTLFWDRPTIDAVAALLAGQINEVDDAA